MKQIVHFLEREALWPVIILLLGAAVILPNLGQSGFWEPMEIGIADRAKKRMSESRADQQETDQADPAGKGKKARPKGRTADDVKPRLTEWTVGHGLKYVKPPSLGARLPLAALGLLALVAAFFLGKRLASPRAGLFAGAILLSFPLFLFQSRQLMSDIGAVTGSALVVLGLTGLAWPVGRRPRRKHDGAEHECSHADQPEHRAWLYATDTALVAVGAVISYHASAALLGIVVPFGAVGIACLAALVGRMHIERDAACTVEVETTGRDRPAYIAVGLALLTLAALAALVLPEGAARHVLSYAFVPALAGVVLVVMGLAPRSRRHRLSGDACWRRWHLVTVGLAAFAVALAALFVVLAQIFDIKDPIPGDRALFGHSLLANHDPLTLLGGQWRERVVSDATFDTHFEHIAFGLFPWVVLAPVAIAHLTMGLKPGRFTFSGYLLFAWAALAWIVCGLMARKVGPVLYPALVPIAVAVAMWLDDLMDARDQADATTESEYDSRVRFGMPLRPPLVAFFAFMAAVALAVNIAFFPDRFLSVNTLGSALEYPKGDLARVLKIKLSAWVALFGVLFAVALSLGLFLWGSHKRLHHASPVVVAIRRRGIHAALAIGVLFALFLTQVWMPRLSEQLSSKDMFATYKRLRAPGEELGLLGQYGSAPDLYVEGEYRAMRSQGELVVFMGAKDRVFAMVPSSNQCALNRALTQSGTYYVLERNAKNLLISNQLKPEQGEQDINSLSSWIASERPADIGSPMNVNYDGRIELIGVDMPKSVARGDTFTMTMYYKVLKPISGSWKVFVHFDGGGARFQGDHEPIEGLCNTNFWQPGDYIIDRFTVDAGDITFRKTEYAVHVGFFQGSHGNWKNMNVVSADSPAGKLTIGSDKRVRVGTIRVH